mmetsp:Transcript_22781/g.52706  ORF Transcript_22781/g.52706 Transcript_22781/m.52706 type:complete len:221 (-) Transcript_22781:222-884(-)
MLRTPRIMVVSKADMASFVPKRSPGADPTKSGATCSPLSTRTNLTRPVSLLLPGIPTARKLSTTATAFPKLSDAKLPTKGPPKLFHIDNDGISDGTELGDAETEGEGVGAADEGDRVAIAGVLLFNPTPTPRPTARAKANPTIIKQTMNLRCFCVSFLSSYVSSEIRKPSIVIGATAAGKTSIEASAEGWDVSTVSGSGIDCRCSCITKDWCTPLVGCMA